MGRLPLIIGHRGASALAPENTLAAFRQAIADGADGIEFDVRLSRDGAAVVIHDSTLERTGRLKRRVSQMTAAELQASDVGSWFRRHGSSHTDFANETVPLLEQVFALFRSGHKKLYLEIKADSGSGNDLVAEVVRLIHQSPIRKRVIVECFNLALIRRIKELDSRIRTAALFEPKLSNPTSLVRRDLPRLAAAAGADEIALHHSLAKRHTIEQALRLNQIVVVWTVDNPKWVAKAHAYEIAALISNNPKVLIDTRDDIAV